MTRRRPGAALALALLLAGCGGDDAVRSGTDRPERSAPLVGLALDPEHPVREASRRALQDAAALRGARLRVLRLPDLDRADAVIVLARDPIDLRRAARAANARGVPLIALGRAPAPEARSIPDGQVTGDPVADGRTAGRAFEAAGRPLRVLQLLGARDDLSTSDGLEGELAQGPVRVVATATTAGVPERARELTLAELRRDPRIDAVFVPTDVLLPAVLGALRTLRRLHPVGHPRHVTLVTVDGAPAACAALRAGYADAVVALPVIALAQRAVDAAVTAVKRPDAPAVRVALPGTVVRKGDRRRAWGCRTTR